MAQTTVMLEVYGVPVELRRVGEGAPLLYLHGGAGDADWLPMLDHVAQHFTVYHPSHPGFGKSGGIEHLDGIEDLVLHYVDVINALDLHGGQLRVAGSSFGGWVAAELAQRYPNLVKRLVLIDAAGLHVDRAPIFELFGTLPAQLAPKLFYDQTQPMAMAMQMDFTTLPEEVLLPQFKAMEALAKFAWNPYFHNPKLEPRLNRITAPTLVVWGRQDGLIPLAHGERYATRIPGARLAVIDHCGHLPAIEQPDKLVELIVPFLK